jgi:hypothetical protein
VLDLLVSIWDAFADSSFMRWFLLGALIGLALVIILLLRGIGLDFWEGAGGVLVFGLASVTVRFVRWIRVG